MDNYEKDLIRLRKTKEFLLKEHTELYQNYVRVIANNDLVNAELTESLTALKEHQSQWQIKEQEYIDRANASAAEQLEMAIQIKHLTRELGLYEKGKKKPTRKPATKRKRLNDMGVR